MATRNGKLAQLPSHIREQLNLRLLEGETGRELAAWLNDLPEVQSILGSHFNGSPISEVNLTHWRQGGYLQWLTERECFDSAHALADGDCNLATTGLSAERLLNVLTVRFGQLLMRWDCAFDESVSQTAAFTEIAKKARILQGISRSLLAIHRIQSQSPSKTLGSATTSANSHASPKKDTNPSPATADCSAEVRPENKSAEPSGRGALRQAQGLEQAQRVETAGGGNGNARESAGGVKGKGRAIPEILSGLISPASGPLNLASTPFKADLDLSEILQAV